MKMRVDPIAFEILRHRLWSINEEAANTLERVSGSLIASEVHDMNASIMTARGDSLVIAPYMLVHAISMETVAKDVIATCAENPGIMPTRPTSATDLCGWRSRSRASPSPNIPRR